MKKEFCVVVDASLFVVSFVDVEVPLEDSSDSVSFSSSSVVVGIFIVVGFNKLKIDKSSSSFEFAGVVVVVLESS